MKKVPVDSWHEQSYVEARDDVERVVEIVNSMHAPDDVSLRRSGYHSRHRYAN